MRSLLILSLFLSAQALADLDCSQQAQSLPRPSVKAGTEDHANPIRHILVIMQENHSFDNYFGSLNDPRFYGNQIDGIDKSKSNQNSKGETVSVFPENTLCVADPNHDWDAIHRDWDGGKMDGFVVTNDKDDTGKRIMGYYTADDLPFYYSLANAFAVGDRYFSSALTQTFPNRFYLLAGTSFGQVRNEIPKDEKMYAQKTLFDILTAYGITWKYYSDGYGYLKLFRPMYHRNLDKMKKIKDYGTDLADGTLPQVAFLDSSFDGEDEHPDADIQVGESWAAARITSLMKSSAWKESVLFLTYDEGGGFYDHVPPPRACKPDHIKPRLESKDVPGAFDIYGIRVPFVAISPYAKHHYVSHMTYDHTSILKYIETKFNLPALSARDANANGFTDIFDYSHPVFDVPEFQTSDPNNPRRCKQAKTFTNITEKYLYH